MPAPRLTEWISSYADPWTLPTWAWVLPWRWWRLYLHVGDWLLFRLWWASRSIMWRLEDAIVAEEERGGRYR